MPQFLAGELKTAKLTMRNPKTAGFDYTVELCMGYPSLVTMASASLRLEAGQEKQISLSVVMPTIPGTYPVYVVLTSPGYFLGLYRAIEDVVVVEPPYPLLPRGHIIEVIFIIEIIGVSRTLTSINVVWRNGGTSPIHGWVECLELESSQSYGGYVTGYNRNVIAQPGEIVTSTFPGKWNNPNETFRFHIKFRDLYTGETLEERDISWYCPESPP